MWQHAPFAQRCVHWTSCSVLCLIFIFNFFLANDSYDLFRPLQKRGGIGIRKKNKTKPFFLEYCLQTLWFIENNTPKPRLQENNTSVSIHAGRAPDLSKWSNANWKKVGTEKKKKKSLWPTRLSCYPPSIIRWENVQTISSRPSEHLNGPEKVRL